MENYVNLLKNDKISDLMDNLTKDLFPYINNDKKVTVDIKPIKYEIGKYYLLNTDQYYWIPDLQEHVKFKDCVAIKLTNFFNNVPAYGKLVRIGKGPFNEDDETNIDIELTGGLGKEYIFNSYVHNVPFFYMDFKTLSD